METKKIELNLSSTALGASGCILNTVRTIIGELDSEGKPDGLGGYKTIPSSSAIYGTAVHKFTDTMFKTKGRIDLARNESEKIFFLTKEPPPEKQGYLGNPKHLFTTCYNLWTEQIEAEDSFELLEIPVECWWCKGSGKVKEIECKSCTGKGVVYGPATEITFRIPFYEDDTFIIYLCGTIDSIGKFKNGCYAIRDWKTTSTWNAKNYLKQYELSRQLRLYTLACKLEAELNPGSVLGKVGSTKMGAFIDAVFLKQSANDNEYSRSVVFQFSEKEMRDFHILLTNFCKKLLEHIRSGYLPKEGILNGTCSPKYFDCKFWHCCGNNDTVAAALLKRDFTRKVFNPLDYNAE